MNKKLLTSIGLTAILAGSVFGLTACGEETVKLQDLKTGFQAEITAMKSGNFTERSLTIRGESFNDYVAPKYDDITLMASANPLSNFYELRYLYDFTLGYSIEYIESAFSSIENTKGNFQKYYNEIGSAFNNFKKAKTNFENEFEKYDAFVSTELNLSSITTQAAFLNLKKEYKNFVSETLDLALCFKDFQDKEHGVENSVEIISDKSLNTYSFIKNINLEMLDAYFNFMAEKTNAVGVDGLKDDFNSMTSVKLISVKNEFLEFVENMGNFDNEEYLTKEKIEKIYELFNNMKFSLEKIQNNINDINWGNFLFQNNGAVSEYSVGNQQRIDEVLLFYTTTLSSFTEHYLSLT